MKSKILILLLALVSVSAFGQRTKVQDLEIQKRIFKTGECTPSAISTDQDDYTLDDGCTIFKLSASTPVTISGFTGGSKGREIVVTNVGSNSITLTHEDDGSTAANRMLIPGQGQVVMEQYSTVNLRYDNSLSRWLVMSRGDATLTDVEGIRFVGRSDSTTISNVGQIQFDADDDKFRFNDGNGWYSFLKEGATLPYWPLTGTASLTGATNIDTDGNNLTIGDPTFAGEYFAIESTIGAVFGSSQSFFHANSTGLGITLSGSAEGDIYYNTQIGGINYLAPLAAAASGNVLLSGTAPSWGKVGLTSHVSGTLGVANGGTGKTSIASNRLLWSTSSNTYGERGVGNLLTMGSTDLELGGTATKTTNLAGASQELNIGTVASPFGATAFNLGATAFNLGDVDFNASGEFDLSIGTGEDGIIRNFRMWRFSARPTDLDEYHSVYFTVSSGSSGPTGTNKGSVVKISDPVRAVWSTSNKSALLIGESIAQTASSFTSESGLLYESTWNPNAGTGTLNILHVKPNINTTSSYSGTVRGFYYNPTLTSTTGLTNIAFEATSGNIVFPTLSELDTAAWVLVRENSTGLIKKRSASSLAGSNGWPLTGTAALTGNVTINGGGTRDLSLGSSGSRLDDLSLYADNQALINVASGNNVNRVTLQPGLSSFTLLDTDGMTLDVQILVQPGEADILRIVKDESVTVFEINADGSIVYGAPPTNCTGRATNTIWSDGGTLKLCP